MSSKGSIKGHQGWKEVASGIGKGILGGLVVLVVIVVLYTLSQLFISPRPNLNPISYTIGLAVGCSVLISTIVIGPLIIGLVNILTSRVSFNYTYQDLKSCFQKFLVFLLFSLHLLMLVFLVTLVSYSHNVLTIVKIDIHRFISNLKSLGGLGSLVLFFIPLLGVGSARARKEFMESIFEEIFTNTPRFFALADSWAFQITFALALWGIIFALALPNTPPDNLSDTVVASIFTYVVWYFVSAGIIIPALLQLTTFKVTKPKNSRRKFQNNNVNLD